MDNLYYIPDIEEFAIGLECEIKKITDREITWEPAVMDERNISWIISKFKSVKMDGPQVRMKFLDQSDIEECGFTHTKTVLQEFYEWKDVHAKPEVYGYRIWELQCCHRPDTHWFELKAHFEDDNWSTLFEGKIRNKSELKKLLKQIGI